MTNVKNGSTSSVKVSIQRKLQEYEVVALQLKKLAIVLFMYM